MIRLRPATARRLAATITAVSLACDGAALILLAIEVANGWLPIDQPGVVQTAISVTVFAVAFPLLGWVILNRLPGSPLGWIYLTIGFCQALNMAASSYSGVSYNLGGGDLPLADLASWVSVWAWVPGFALFSTVGILLFPTGHLPSGRWRVVVVLAVIAVVMLLAPAVAVWPYRGQVLERVAQLGTTPPGSPVIDLAFTLQAAGQIVLLAAMIGSVAGLAVRFRRSVGVERQQLKWFTYAAILDVGLLIVWTLNVLDPVTSAVSALLFASFPIAITIAILRYRLYDIDRIVSRTIAYVIISAILGATFAATVLIAEALVEPFLQQVTQTRALAIAASTLAAAALFQPVRRRVQSIVDNRFDRARIDRDRSIVALGTRLRNAVELEAIRADVLATVDATVRPDGAALWLRRR